MLDRLNCFRREIKINDFITIRNPTLKEIVDYGEQDFYSLMCVLTFTKHNVKTALLEVLSGIDETDIDCITDFEFFILSYYRNDLMVADKAKIIFGDFDMQGLEISEDEKTGKVILVDDKNNIVMNENDYKRMTEILWKIYRLEDKLFVDYTSLSFRPDKNCGDLTLEKIINSYPLLAYYNFPTYIFIMQTRNKIIETIYNGLAEIRREVFNYGE